MREWLSVAIAAFIVLVARSSFADHYVVPSGSMLPTVAEGDRVLVAKAAYGLRLPLTDQWLVNTAEPQRGDVVVLESPEDAVVLLKRIAALPGDRVEIRAGRLRIDDRDVPVVAEGDGPVELLGSGQHRLRLDAGGGPDFGPVIVPAGRYLVLGDNRGNSHDGRSFGCVERDAILGRVLGVFQRDGSFVWLPL